MNKQEKIIVLLKMWSILKKCNLVVLFKTRIDLSGF